MSAARFSTEEARSIGEAIGIDWGESPFDVEQFQMGLEVELNTAGGTRIPTSPKTTPS
jgi:hypothetical protein